MSRPTSPNPIAGGAPATTLGPEAIDELMVANGRATSEICPLLSPKVVASSFDEKRPLTTQPMVEGHGPACGYRHPREGGYLLVVQFQALAEWDRHVAQGRRVDGLGHPARLEIEAGVRLYVLDNGRNAVVMFLSLMTDIDVTALFRVAANVYGIQASDVIISTS